jgi:hypothetical protein
MGRSGRRAVEAVVIPGRRGNTVIPGWCVSTRPQMCAAHRGIPRFQVRRCRAAPE